MFQRRSRILWPSLFFAVALFVFFGAPIIFAEEREEKKVNYQEEIIVDSDFDGLTDQGEKQLYGTDPIMPDTDIDGFYDGTEIIRASDPLDPTDPVNLKEAQLIRDSLERTEAPWAWYLTRSAGLLAYFFLWLTVFFGLAIRNDWLKKLVQPIYSFGFHCFLGASSLFWAFIHGTAILFDRYLGMKWKDILIPYHFNYLNFRADSVDLLAFGIVAFYLMVVLVATSYLRQFLSQRVWRILHFVNPLAFILVVLHGLYLGTDLKDYGPQKTFLLLALFLVLVYFSNLAFLIRNKLKAKSVVSQPADVRPGEADPNPKKIRKV